MATISLLLLSATATCCSDVADAILIPEKHPNNNLFSLVSLLLIAFIYHYSLLKQIHRAWTVFSWLAGAT